MEPHRWLQWLSASSTSTSRLPFVLPSEDFILYWYITQQDNILSVMATLAFRAILRLSWWLAREADQWKSAGTRYKLVIILNKLESNLFVSEFHAPTTPFYDLDHGQLPFHLWIEGKLQRMNFLQCMLIVVNNCSNIVKSQTKNIPALYCYRLHSSHYWCLWKDHS